MFTRIFVIAVLSLAFVGGCDHQANVRSEYPSRPIKLIVPFNAGGSSDTFARTVQKAIAEHDLLPEPIVIVNRGGAGGTIGSRYFKHRRPDGYTLMLLHQAVLTAKYAGKVEYGPEAFDAIAGTSEESAVIVVAEVEEDSARTNYETLADLFAKASNDSGTVKVAVNFGAPSHFLVQRLEAESGGATFRYVQSGGGSDRFGAIAGGHVDATIFSVGEYLQFQASGLRALAVFDDERNPAIPEVPTAKEMGINVVDTNMQYWWAPRGTPPERIETIRTALRQAMETDEVRQALSMIEAKSTFLNGHEVRQRLARAEKELSMDVVQAPEHLAWLPAIIAGCTVLLGGITLARNGIVREVTPSNMSTNRAALFGVATILYAAVLTTELVDYRIATLLFMAAAGAVMIRREWKAIGGYAAVTLIIVFGVHYLMAGLMGVDLP